MSEHRPGHDEAGATKTRAAPRGRKPQSKALRAAKEAAYRNHILGVAEQVFAAQGFAHTKMQEIARQAGMSLGTLYQSYPSKQDLYRGVLIARDSEMLESVMRHGQAVLQAPQSIEHLLWLQGVHLQFLLEHPDYLRMQLQEGYAWYHDAARPSSEEQQMWMRGMSVIEHVFRWGMDRGWLVPGTPADEARMLMALQQTRLANWVSAGMESAQQSVIARIRADFVRQFCQPAVAATLLEPDGGALNATTIARLAAIDQGLPPLPESATAAARPG